jgi:hypothetical protein
LTPGRPDLDTNKRNVGALYDLVFSEDRPAEAIERYAGDTHIQQTPRSARPRMRVGDALVVVSDAGSTS